MPSRLIELGFTDQEMYDLADCDRYTSERGFGILSGLLQAGEIIVACWKRSYGGETRSLRVNSAATLEHIVTCINYYRCTDLQFVAMPVTEAPEERALPWDHDDLFGAS